MYDRDIQLIQFCAATLPPDTFILHCLNKFNLINWASKDFAVSEEESIRYFIKCGVFLIFVSYSNFNDAFIGLKKKNEPHSIGWQ